MESQVVESRCDGRDDVARDDAGLAHRLGHPLGGAAVHPRAAHRGFEGGHAAGEEAGDHPGEDVARAGGGERGAAGVVERDPAGPAADRGLGDHRSGPFSRTTAVLRSASRCAAAIRSSPTGWPARRAYSPSWGVSDRGRAEGLARAQRLEIAVERVEAVGVEHERDACFGDEREHRLTHRGVRAEPGPERERAEP